MSEFSSRSSGYKAGVVLLFFSAIAFFVGYTTPFWFYYAASSEHLIKKERSSDYIRSEGLWMMCESGTRFSGFFQTRCVTYPLDIVLPWFHAVRALASISLIGLFMACVYALVTNCCRSIPGPVTSILEALSVFSGVLGLTGCAVLAAEAATKEHFGWSLKLSAIGSGLCVVAAFIIAVFKPLPTSALGAVGQVITMATISQVQSYTTAGGQAQAQPFRNPQSYGGPQSYGNPQPYGNPQSYGNAQPYGNPQAYGNVYGYGNPEPYGNPTTYPGPQPNNQADQA